jgi:hypothetical protein
MNIFTIEEYADVHLIYGLRSEVKLSCFMPWRCFGGGYSSYSFLTSALHGGEWSLSRPGLALPPKKGLSVPIG